MTTLAGVAKTLVLYLLALVVGVFVALYTAFPLAGLTHSILVVCGVTGFISVLLPSFIVPRPSRWFCAMFLLVVGAGFYYFRFIKQEPGEDPQIPMLQRASSIVPLIGGGLAAVLIHWRRRQSGRVLQPAATAP